jgi:hypothetical protein
MMGDIRAIGAFIIMAAAADIARVLGCTVDDLIMHDEAEAV